MFDRALSSWVLNVTFNSIWVCSGLSFDVNALRRAHSHIYKEELSGVEKCSPIMPQQRLLFILLEFQLSTLFNH